MKVNITSVIWYGELDVANKDKEAYELKDLSLDYFKNKSYCPEVREYDIFWESPPPRAIPFVKPRRPVYYADRIMHAPPDMRGFSPIRLQKNMSICVFVDFDEYISQTTKVGGWNVIGKAVLSYLREMKYPVVLRKVFDRERFNSDMEAFFRSLGCSIE